MEKETRQRGAENFKVGAGGGALGVLAGLIQLVFGSDLGILTGNKDNPFALGLVTILLSAFALYCSYRASNETSTDVNKRLAWILGILLPAGICFTTAGLIWMVPGILLLGASLRFIRDLKREFEEKDLELIPEIPRWKRTVILAGALVILIPVIFGGFVPTTELAYLEQDGDEYFVRPIERVVIEGAGGEDSSSEVTGVMIIHILMVLGALVALVTGQLGARILTIASAVIVVVSLLFFFFLLPNILFIEGAKFSQFDGEHFSALSGGWFMAMFGSILLLASQFIHHEANRE
ncbi:MAG: hypothetical protein ACMUHU_03580 [Thermoplasmatota archaeon]